MLRLVQIFAVVLLIAVLYGVGLTAANVTVCEGDDCTVISGGVVRKLTPIEVREKRRSEALSAIWRLDCAVANDPNSCREAIRGMARQFSRP